MPELPEVETVLRILEQQIQNTRITEIEVPYEKIIDNVSVDEFCSLLRKEAFQSFTRKGKYLIFGMQEVTLVVHLRMEGKFYLRDANEIFDQKHVHLIFHLSDGRRLCYHDTRKFGRFYVYQKGLPLDCLRQVGLEPWDASLDATWLYEKVKKHSKMTVKDFLLDQRFIAGIGNIYANEICFHIAVHPESRVSSLTKKLCQELIDAVRIILERAIAMGGTTIRSYTSSLGVTGRFQLTLSVYQKDGEMCERCGATIRRSLLHGRGTFFCPGCQKRRRAK